MKYFLSYIKECPTGTYLFLSRLYRLLLLYKLQSSNCNNMQCMQINKTITRSQHECAIDRIRLRPEDLLSTNMVQLKTMVYAHRNIVHVLTLIIRMQFVVWILSSIPRNMNILHVSCSDNLLVRTPDRFSHAVFSTNVFPRHVLYVREHDFEYIFVFE